MLAPLRSHPIPEANGWLGKLELRYALKGERTVLHHAHEGPLRVLKSLYPEDPRVCHNVLVHPPSGLIGSDRIEIQVFMEEGAHGLITTPGATRFLGRSKQWASQKLDVHLQAGSRLEWLPLETLVYSGAWARNQQRFNLAPDSSCMAWDVYALGLAATNQPFQEGALEIKSEWPGRWLERGFIRADDRILRTGPLGLQGRQALGQMVLIWEDLATLSSAAHIETLLEVTRAHLSSCLSPSQDQTASSAIWGVTQSQPGVIHLRMLADHPHLIQEAFEQVWPIWRHLAWGMKATPCRSWAL